MILYHHTPALSPLQTDELLLLYIGNILATGVYEKSMQLHLGQSPVDARVPGALGLKQEEVAQVDESLIEALESFQQRHIAT